MRSSAPVTTCDYIFQAYVFVTFWLPFFIIVSPLLPIMWIVDALDFDKPTLKLEPVPHKPRTVKIREAIEVK